MIHPALHRFLANQIGLFIYLIRHKTINISSKHPVSVGSVTTRMQTFMMSDLFAGSAQAPQESCCILLLFTVTQIPVQTPQTLTCCFTLPLFRYWRHNCQSIVVFRK